LNPLLEKVEQKIISTLSTLSTFGKSGAKIIKGGAKIIKG